MKEYLQRLHLGSTLFAFAAVGTAIAVIRTDLDHRSHRQLAEQSPAIQTAKTHPPNALGEVVDRSSLLAIELSSDPP